MSTEYIITERLMLEEQSSLVDFIVYEEATGFRMHLEGLTEAQLRTAILRMIRVLSYVSEDPYEVMTRFNVTFDDIV